MNVGAYELIGNWKVSNVGFTALAMRGHKKYFLKRYGEYKKPRRNASTSDKLYARLEREFNDFVKYRSAVNEALSTVACEGGNIILPTHWFVDDINFIEATQFIDGLLEDKEIMALPVDQLHFVMMTAAKAVKEIHGKNIVHSDLKRTNILAARNSSGKVVAKIIDFDKSYFPNRVRENDLGGDQLYMSPELTWCLISECEEDAVSKLSTKSDVFSLGIVFYNYLTKGEFPQITGLTGKLKEKEDSGKAVYCGEALVSGAKLVISKKIKDEYMQRLLANMLYLDPEKRISAQEVLDVLKNKRVLAFDPNQGIVINGTTSTFSTRPSTPTERSDTDIPRSYCEPWDEHKCKFVIAELKASGFVSSKKINRKGVNCYQFYRADGTHNIFSINTLRILGWVTDISSADEKRDEKTSDTFVPSDDVWDSDAGYRIYNEKAKNDGYAGIAKHRKNGRNGYVLLRKDGTNQFVLINQLLMIGYAEKK